MSNLKEMKSGVIKGLLPKRLDSSHKGDNGRVLVIGGSLDYYGAPILAGLGALYSGADLVYLYVPECNFDVTRASTPDFIVKSYAGNYLTERSASQIVEFGKKCNSLVIGPGIGENENTLDAVLEIVNSLKIPTVLDSSAIMALKKMKSLPLEQDIVITPHAKEFRDLVDRDVVVSEEDTTSIILMRSISMDLGLSVLLKGKKDYVSSKEGDVEINLTGNAGMTVGGSGDVLAGVVGTMLAQGLNGFDASRVSAYVVGLAGDLLKKEKGYAFSASDLANKLPYALSKI